MRIFSSQTPVPSPCSSHLESTVGKSVLRNDLSPELRPILGGLFKLQVLSLVARQMNIKQLQHKLSSVFFILAFLIGVQRYLRVILICLFLMTKHVEQLLRCLPATSDSSVENSVFRVYPIF